MKRLYFTVTNDLVYDQRMIRICRSLAAVGYSVALVGRRLPGSIPLRDEPFGQKRLRCLLRSGKGFYMEYNLRLFFFLLFRRMDGICAIDLDTILPCLWISRWKKIPRIYDAHEWFPEMKEVITRPLIKKAWTRVERYSVPKFAQGYTVSRSIADEFRKRYGVNYELIRNVPVLEDSFHSSSALPSSSSRPPSSPPLSPSVLSSPPSSFPPPYPGWHPEERFILYQGAVITVFGLALGNAFTLLIWWLQNKYGFITLPEDAYFISKAVIKLEWWHLVLVNAGTFLICFLVLMIPTLVVRKVQPVRAIQFR